MLHLKGAVDQEGALTKLEGIDARVVEISNQHLWRVDVRPRFDIPGALGFFCKIAFRIRFERYQREPRSSYM